MSHLILLSDNVSDEGTKVANSSIQQPDVGVVEYMLTMKYVPNDDDVSVGERVITSGMDRIFPRDLPVGTITAIQPGVNFKQIRIKPAANLEKLEEVLVLLTLHPLKGNDAPEAKPPAPVASNPAPPQVANP